MPIDRSRFVNFSGAPDLSVNRQSIKPRPDFFVDLPFPGIYLLAENGFVLLTEDGLGLSMEEENEG